VAARGANGVAAVLTGDDVKALTSSLVVGVKASVECWPIAVGRVRYVGEPVAVVVASDRYLAEDAVDLIDVQSAFGPASSIRFSPWLPMLRFCTMVFQETWRAIGRFAMAIQSARSPRLLDGSRSISAIRAIPARPSRLTASSRNMTRRRAPSTSSRIFRDLSVSMP
jgi:hypothetical protein